MTVTIIAVISVVILSLMLGLGSIKIIAEGNEALVERLGRFHRKLEPGLHFIRPFIDKIVIESTVRERVLDTQPQQAITRDNVAVGVDAVVFWQIQNLERAYYTIEDIELAIENLVLTRLRSLIGELDLDQTYTSRFELNRQLHELVDEIVGTWGIQVKRTEIQDISPPRSVLEALEVERARESFKYAQIYDAEATANSLDIIYRTLQDKPNSQQAQQAVNLLLALRYIDANQKLGESANSKIVFMDPSMPSQVIDELIAADLDISKILHSSSTHLDSQMSQS